MSEDNMTHFGTPIQHIKAGLCAQETKPNTTGEWTLQKVGRFFDLRISDNYTIRTEDDITAALYKDIVKAHNAAIAKVKEGK